jgi:hypothetical protein
MITMKNKADTLADKTFMRFMLTPTLMINSLHMSARPQRPTVFRREQMALKNEQVQPELPNF